MNLQEVIDWDLAVRPSVLTKITGYSREELKRIDPPYVCGKCTPSDFRSHVKKLQKQFRPKASASTERNGGQPLVSDTPSAPSNWNVQQAASRLIGKSLARSSV